MAGGSGITTLRCLIRYWDINHPLMFTKMSACCPKCGRPYTTGHQMEFIRRDGRLYLIQPDEIMKTKIGSLTCLYSGPANQGYLTVNFL